MKWGSSFLTMGVLALFCMAARGTTFYVNANNPFPSPPYATWATAATNIQDALNMASSGSIVLVTNGVYQYGSGGAPYNTSRVYVPYPNITVQSVNGPAVTVIKGYQVPGTTNGTGAIRGVYLPGGSILAGFTVTGGADTSSSFSGGGILCGSQTALVINCIITGNSAMAEGGGVYSGNLVGCVISNNVAFNTGGGAYGSVLNNCQLLSNSANQGGGVWGGSLTNCLIVGNSAVNGGGIYNSPNVVNCTIVGNSTSGNAGGVFSSTLYNCIIYYNTGSIGMFQTNAYNCMLNNCCTIPAQWSVGSPNFTNAPAFVDMAHSNFRLQTGSPCIDAGTNLSVMASTDLDGNPRVAGAAVDMGAYENQNTNLIHFVSLSSTNAVAPYTNWLTAATNIQDAINVAQPGEIVAANAGSYTNGGVVMFGAETNRVAVTNGVTLLGVYGPSSTLIVGGTQMRCAYVDSNSLLAGFTITNGHTRTAYSGDVINEQSGGGVLCQPGGIVANCLIANNFAYAYNGYYTNGGGGVYGGTVSNCILTANYATMGGGAAGGVLYNCLLLANQGGGGGGAAFAALYNCTLSNNVVVASDVNRNGAGASQCWASNCLFINNTNLHTSYYAGGAYQGTNINCTFIGNSAGAGGGTYQSTNYNCLISQNMAANSGGGAYQGTLYNCLLIGNFQTSTNNYPNSGGAGACLSTLVDCTVANNTAALGGGGVYGGTAYNSIIYSNNAPQGANWTNSPLMYYCCTTPLMQSAGTGCITNEPLFVDAAGGDYQLQCSSPCIDGGIIYFNGPAQDTNDIRGMARPLDGNNDGLKQVDMGAYEYNPATDHTPAIRFNYGPAKISLGYAASFVAQVDGCQDYYWWDFGDGTTVSNQFAVSHSWASSGLYNLQLSAVYSGHVFSTVIMVQVVPQPVYYVNAYNISNFKAPYTTFATAATNIQSAVNVDNTLGRLVLVTNGTYSTAGTIMTGSMLNSLVMTNAVIVKSFNGPQFTTLNTQPNQFGIPERCGYVCGGAVLSGFTITGGRPIQGSPVTNDNGGGGLWCEPGAVITNCVITRNNAGNFGGGAFGGSFYSCVISNNYVNSGFGGGVSGATLYNCQILNNYTSAQSYGAGAYQCQIYNSTVCSNGLIGGSDFGGGAASSTLYNCVVSNNYGYYGGGGYASTFWNCLLTVNRGFPQGGGAYNSALYNCTVANNTGYTGGGTYYGSATNCIIYLNVATDGSTSSNWVGTTLGWSCTAPLASGSGNVANDPLFINPTNDFHLAPDSPCINTGMNVLVYGATDLDGNPRIMGGTADMGTYEFQAQVTGTFAAWLQQYGLPTDGSADYADSDGTGMLNWQKWIAGLDPTNPASVLAMVPVPAANQTNGVTVSWQSVNTRNYFLQRSPGLSAPMAFTTIQTNIPGQPGITTYTDATATNGGPYYYRVGVQ